MPEIFFGSVVINPGIWGVAIAAIAIVWFLNLFNFMDGIDGIAASEAIFMAGGGALLAVLFGKDDANVQMLYCVAAASAGFLTLNWAPARIFMGDVGSGFLGIIIALLALWSAHEGVLSIWTWLILGSLFIADATMTLFKRVLQGERWYSAHRSHVYQQLSRRWDSHARVTLLYIGVNVLIVWPLAYLSVGMPELAWVVAFILIALLCLAAWTLGAGSGSA